MEAIPEYKIILLGEPGVGKTNFFLRLRNGTFAGSSAVSASMGTELLEYSVTIRGVNVKVRAMFGFSARRGVSVLKHPHRELDLTVWVYYCVLKCAGEAYTAIYNGSLFFAIQFYYFFIVFFLFYLLGLIEHYD